jgi:hypothetical protein
MVMRYRPSRGPSANVLPPALNYEPATGPAAASGPSRQSAAALRCQASAVVEGGDHAVLKEPAVRADKLLVR